MTLDEAIEHCYKKYKELNKHCRKCALEHYQLYKWLKELKAYKEIEARKTLKIDNLEDIKTYLDNCIRAWRSKRDNEHCYFAKYYIDAYQSVRYSIFGECLPADEKEVKDDVDYSIK